MTDELFRATDLQQMTHEARVHEEELRGLHEPLTDVGQERRDPEHDVARLEHREPTSNRVMTDTNVRAKRAVVQFLPRAAGCEPQKGCEGLQISHIEQLANVTLNVSRHIVAEPIVGGDALVPDSRIRPRPKRTGQLERWPVEPKQLVAARRQQRDDGGTPC